MTCVMCDPEGNPCDRCKLNDEPDIDSYIEEMEELNKKQEDQILFRGEE